MGNTLARARSLVRGFLALKDDEAFSLRKELRRLTERIEQLEEAQRSATELAGRAARTALQTELVSVLNRRHEQDIERLPALLDDSRIAEHVRRAVEAAPLLIDPYEHIVVERVLPDDVYDLLIRAIPPPAFFDDRDLIKQTVTFPMELAPALTAVAWGYMDEVIARQVIRAAVLEKFHEPLQRYFTSMFGAEFLDRANSLPQAAYGGRLMLAHAGYHLGPHRDPKRAMLTCLMYLAREGDNEAHGTQVFRVLDDREAEYKQTYYPEEEGRTCELVKVVPFRRNTMLVNLNSRGAHGATISPDAGADIERYAYQFYVAPLNEALSALIKSLPPVRRNNWRSKALVKSDHA